ncbi:flagellar protein FlaG [Luminiphilus sp.]|nr:flagellar protein FlaG [Luminiphilus sp.]MDB2312911.1 flagellar protein FlaG [Luminiphilus sp.]
MADLNPVNGLVRSISDFRSVEGAQQLAETKAVVDLKKQVSTVRSDEVSKEGLEKSAETVEKVVNAVTQDTSLSFRVEEDLSRMVVAVRAVGSDEIIRQFPPEEFITVAKFIASQDPGMVDEDFLKGVLFDQYT